MTATKVIIVGAGDFGRECASWITDDPALRSLPLVGFLSDEPHALDKYQHYTERIIGDVSSHQPELETAYVMAISDPRAKLAMGNLLKSRGAQFPVVIHSTAVVARYVQFGSGVIVCPGAVISADANVGNFVTINLQCTIGHDVIIGNGTTLSAHVDLTGRVHVDEGAFFGSHAVALPGAHVGAYAKVGAGSVVLKTVRPGATVMGVPAKHITP